MAPTRSRIDETAYPSLRTCTVVGGLVVGRRPQAVPMVFDSWNFLVPEQGVRLYGDVILENHLHLRIAGQPPITGASCPNGQDDVRRGRRSDTPPHEPHLR